jgi:uncharacterized protein with GYD domain
LRRAAMPKQTYLVLCNYTEKGLEAVKSSPARLDEATAKAWRALGCKLKEFYLLMSGEYDIAIIVEAPNDDAATQLALSIGSRGAIRAKIQRAYPNKEYRQIIGSLP